MQVPKRANQEVILFDGVCNMCAAVVRFVIQRDPKGRFQFAALQSDMGRLLLEKHGLQPGRLDTFVLVQGERSWIKSTAALRVCRGLKGLWPLLYAGIVVPRRVRDLMYQWVARNRYRWFGKTDSCMMPTPELRKRFLD
ncbi:thiol-disulfide oxidoreductase DCC family protein [Paenibacillus sp. MBLB4367]|uniref:thiol-disulfide oxidoreductase DCC family protein n=1 Tax=Paenibacillus sp. MBLB4367 TaxID=3384767 RepID=UPI00390813CB